MIAWKIAFALRVEYEAPEKTESRLQHSPEIIRKPWFKNRLNPASRSQKMHRRELRCSILRRSGQIHNLRFGNVNAKVRENMKPNQGQLLFRKMSALFECSGEIRLSDRPDAERFMTRAF